jgi:hypothetical protein
LCIFLVSVKCTYQSWFSLFWPLGVDRGIILLWWLYFAIDRTLMDKIIFLILNELYKETHTSLNLYIIVPKSVAAETLLVALVVVHSVTEVWRYKVAVYIVWTLTSRLYFPINIVYNMHSVACLLNLNSCCWYYN